MENNENKVFNPFKQAREQANLQQQNSVTNPNLDMFGNSEAGFTPKAPEVSAEPITPLYMDDVQPSIPMDNQYPFDEVLDSPVEPITPAAQPAFTAPETTFVAPPAEPVITASAEEIAKASEEFEKEVMGIINTNDVNTNPTIVPEEPKKAPKQPRARVLNSNEAVITPEDIKEGRKCAWLAYILFFIPLLINKENAFVRHNANEGLEINLCDLIAGILILLNVVVTGASLVASFLFMIGSIVGWGLLILTTITKLYMIVASLLGKRANTPWFWNIRMIK